MKTSKIMFIFLIITLMIVPSIVYAQSSVRANDIINRIDRGQNIYYENATIIGDLDFTKVNDTELEDKNVYRSYINSGLTFINCNFDGEIIAYKKQGNRAYKTMFQRNVTFSDSTFRKVVIFNHAQFSGNVNFKNAEFEEDARFFGTQFIGNTSFQQARFEENSNFNNAQFIGNVNFKEATFSRLAKFKNTQFIGKAIFKNANFRNNYDFSGATLWGKDVQVNDLLDDDYDDDDDDDDDSNYNNYGLMGEYFKSDNLTNPAFIRTDSEINFDWGYGRPDNALPVDNFSVRWTGKIIPEYTEEYTFYVSSDDGVRLWVNGELLINEWTVHSETQYSGKIRLNAGNNYDIQLDYFEKEGSATVKLYWRSRRQSKEIIPANNLLAKTIDQIMIIDGTEENPANSIEASEVIRMIDNNQSVYLEDKTIIGDLDFTLIKNTKKRGSNYISYVDRSITIRDCFIKGRFIASGNKKSTVFEEGVSFYGTKIQDNTNFKESEFEEFADFSNMHFMNNADFSEIEFKKKVDFVNVRFERDVTFSHTRFDDDARFRNSVFEGNTDFSWAHFSEDADFSNTTFYYKPDFFGTSFFGSKNFSGSTLNGNSFRP